MTAVDPSRLTEALSTLGDALESEGLTFDVVAVGGWALAQLGYIDRPTEDIDLLGRMRDGQIEPMDPLPRRIAELASDTGQLFGLDAGWLNNGPGFLLDGDLPTGFMSRLTANRYGGLTVWLPARIDFVHMKVYAAADRPGTRHGQDLRALNPTRDELRDAALWAFYRSDAVAFEERLKALIDNPETV